MGETVQNDRSILSGTRYSTGKRDKIPTRLPCRIRYLQDVHLPHPTTRPTNSTETENSPYAFLAVIYFRLFMASSSIVQRRCHTSSLCLNSLLQGLHNIIDPGERTVEIYISHSFAIFELYIRWPLDLILLYLDILKRLALTR